VTASPIGRPLVRPGTRGHRTTTGVLLATALLAAGCSSGGGSAPSGSAGTTPAGPTAVGQPAPPGAAGLRAVSCASTTACWAVGSRVGGPVDPTGAPVVVHSADGGVRWSAQTLPPGPGLLLSVSCPDAAHCVATGLGGPAGNGLVEATRDGGARWRVLAPPAGATTVLGVQCRTARRCVVLAQDASGTWSASSADGGATWVRGGTLPTAVVADGQLSCEADTCAVAGHGPSVGGHAGGALAVSTDGGATWSAPTLAPMTGILHGAACRATTCAAIGTSSTAVSDVVPADGQYLASVSGGPWLLSTAAPPIGDGFALTCRTGRSCVAVGTDWVPSVPPTPIGGVAATADGGRTWTMPKLKQLPGTLTGVACPAPTWCVGVGGDAIARINLPRR